VTEGTESRGASADTDADVDADAYTVRPYDHEDRADVLALHETVFDGGDPEWFAWKYETNPYVDEPAIFVAEHGGTIVGARPYLAFRMRAGDDTHLGLQTGDTMVHPDHRRQGLFTRMTAASFERYADGEPAFQFSMPNAVSRPGYLRLGSEVVDELSTYYRVQDPAAFAGDRSRLARVAAPPVRGYLAARDALADPPGEVTVVRHVEPPAATLAALYRRRPPEGIHAHRDERFYDYRLGNPDWEYTAYTARLGETPVAGVVTGNRTVNGRTVTNVAEVVPLVGDDQRDRGLAALLARVVADSADSAVIAVRGSVIPSATLRGLGFHSDRRLPLSAVASPTVLITSPFPVDGDWRVAGRDLREPRNWRLTFLEQNTS
jgi:GNAT superfamily N-acetyltransferase